MRRSFIVEFQEKDTCVNVSLPGPLLLIPRSLDIKEKEGNHVVLVRRKTLVARNMRTAESEIPDILVGSIPLVHFANDGVTTALTYLKIPPPSPFSYGDIEAMWHMIRSNGCPIPHAVALQGQYAPGSVQVMNFSHITAEFLNFAHQQCRQLLTRWPMSESQEFLWRNVELRGGREDFPLTERHGGSVPIFVTKEGHRIPQQTFRRRANDTPWHCYMLREAAAALHDKVYAQTKDQIPTAEIDRFVAPFAAVAKFATPSQPQMDPPMSTWPLEARRCYESLIAAMAALKIDDHGTEPAPLCHLWRLYEGWVAALCLDTIVKYLGTQSREDGPTSADGCEWIAQWRMSNQTTITLIAQPHILEHGLEPLLRPIIPVKSVSSDLVPDVLLVISSEKNFRLVVLDAKKRSQTTSMDPGEVAEAASKYLWGIRSLSPTLDPFPVNLAVIVSTMPPGIMHSSESRIRSICATPSRIDQITRVIQEELNGSLTNL